MSESVGVAVVNFKHQFVWMDEAFAQVVGYSRETLTGMTFDQITHVDDINLDRNLADRLFAGEMDHYEMEKRYIHRDKSTVPIHLKVAMIRDRRRQVVYATATIERRLTKGPLRVETSAPLTSEEREMDRIRRAMMG